MGRLGHTNRVEIIKEGLLNNHKWVEMAKHADVHRTTMWRSFTQWVQTDDFKAFIYDNYLRTLGKVDDTRRLQSLTRVITRYMTERIEQTTEHIGEITLKWKGDDHTKPDS